MRRRGLVSQLYRTARLANDISVITSGNPQRIARRAKNKIVGRAIARAGLWRLSRHPNYFFEWLYWLAYAAMAPADWRVWTSPALMLFFLLKVSGIPATEAQALKSRGDDYRDYQKTTSMFVPWFPRRNA